MKTLRKEEIRFWKLKWPVCGISMSDESDMLKRNISGTAGCSLWNNGHFRTEQSRWLP